MYLYMRFSYNFKILVVCAQNLTLTRNSDSYILLCLEMRNQASTGIPQIQCRSSNNIDRSATKYSYQGFRHKRVSQITETDLSGSHQAILVQSTSFWTNFYTQNNNTIERKREGEIVRKIDSNL